MENAYPYWLSKQMMTGVRRFNIDSYLMALEGWRRGLSLKFYQKSLEVTDLQVIGFDPVGKSFSLSSENRTHYFYRSRGDKVDNAAMEIGTNKQAAKEYLAQAGVPVAEGFTFTSNDSMDEVVHSSLQIGFPLVVKPTFGSLGKGVVTNIQSEEVLRDSLQYVMTEFEYEDFIIERHVSGEDIRVYVIEDQAVAATKRIPANITGDGIQTIEELIEEKNEERKLNPQTSTRLINADQSVKNFLSQRNLKFEYVPGTGKVVYVKGQSNISAGGDSIDVTNDLSDEVKETAIKAVKSIPGLNHAGVDLIADKDKATIIEINSTAGISLHTFPLYGTQQNVAEKIIDYYFPETMGLARESNQIYFDYKNILELLRSNSIKQIEIQDAPVGKLYAKRYVISGDVQGVGFRRWARNEAISNGLHGYTRNLNNGKAVVVVGGTDREVVDEFKDICRQGPDRANVEDVQDYIWDKQIRVGFEIRRENKQNKGSGSKKQS